MADLEDKHWKEKTEGGVGAQAAINSPRQPGHDEDTNEVGAALQPEEA